MFKKINKKILIIVIVTLLMLSFSLSGILLFIKHMTKEDNLDTPKASDALDIGHFFDPNTPEPDDFFEEFKKYDDYIISDSFGFTTFTDIVNNKYDDIDQSFEGKTITLTKDINFGGKELTCVGKRSNLFNGHFNGDGYTLSNFSLVGGYNDTLVTVSSGHSSSWVAAIGLFANVDEDCIIENLKIEDVKFIAPDKDYDIVVFGTIVGKGYGNFTIKNCMVENLTIDLTEFDKYVNTSAAGIIGGGSAIVEDCYISNIKVTKTNEKLTLNSIGPSYKYFKYYSGGFAGLFMEDKVLIDSEDCVVRDCVANVSSADQVSVMSDNLNNVKTSAKDASGLDCSAVGGVISDVDNTWYYASDYNDGWPLLRIFLKLHHWKNVSFHVNPIKYVVSGRNPATIKIPHDAYNRYLWDLSNPKKARIIIYDQEVTVEAKDKYQCSEGGCNNEQSYWLHLDPITVTLVFKDAIIETSNGPITIKPSSTTMEIPYGETLETIKSGNQYIYKYETDSYGMGVIYDLGDAKEYVIESWGLPNGDNSWAVGEGYEGANYVIEITPTFKLKEYGWIFK